MMEEELYELMEAGKGREQQRILQCNEKTAAYGLALTEEEVGRLLVSRRDSLKQQRRVEFGEGILPRLIGAFYDSPYLNDGEYAEVLTRLQEIFYEYKNESMDLVSDDELLTFMREQFDGVCFGSPDYLEGTCLERFARAVRAGGRDYMRSGGTGEYESLSEEKRWDRELYLAAVKELCE